MSKRKIRRHGDSHIAGFIVAPETGTRMVIGYNTSPAGGVITISMGHGLDPEPAAFVTLEPADAEQIITWLQQAVRQTQGD